MLEEDRVSERAISLLLLLPLLLPHETRAPASKPLPKRQTTPLKKRLKGRAEENMAAPGGCSAFSPGRVCAPSNVVLQRKSGVEISHWTAV
jgi:hypothetical protein